MVKNVPVQRSRKFDTTAPVVPGKYLMGAEMTVSQFNQQISESQKKQETKDIPHEFLTAMPQLSRDNAFEEMKKESEGRSADQREAITNEMCNMLTEQIGRTKFMVNKVRKALPDDLDHSNPVSYTKHLNEYLPPREDDTACLRYYDNESSSTRPRTSAQSDSSVEIVRVPRPSTTSPTARRLAVDIVRYEMTEEERGNRGSTSPIKRMPQTRRSLGSGVTVSSNRSIGSDSGLSPVDSTHRESNVGEAKVHFDEASSSKPATPAGLGISKYKSSSKLKKKLPDRYQFDDTTLDFGKIRRFKKLLHEYAKNHILRQADEIYYDVKKNI